MNDEYFQPPNKRVAASAGILAAALCHTPLATIPVTRGEIDRGGRGRAMVVCSPSMNQLGSWTILLPSLTGLVFPIWP